MKVLLGSHVSLSGPGYYPDTVEEAHSYGSSSFMFYTGAPQNTKRLPLDVLKIKEGRELLKIYGIEEDTLVVHAPYIINLANPDEEKGSFAMQFLKEEVERTAAFGINRLVLHPGSAVGGDREEAINLVASRLGKILENDKSNVRIALETMAGKGREIGTTFEEIAEIINRCPMKERLGVTLDTCHISDAGYDVSDIEGILGEFDRAIGLDRLLVIHLNDSKNPMGSHKDRHENLGCGFLGYDTLRKYVLHPALENVPKILETPYYKEKAPYGAEIEMLLTGSFNPEFREYL